MFRARAVVAGPCWTANQPTVPATDPGASSTINVPWSSLIRPLAAKARSTALLAPTPKNWTGSSATSPGRSSTRSSLLTARSRASTTPTP